MDKRFCDFEDCDRDGTDARGTMTYCATHAEEHDANMRTTRARPAKHILQDALEETGAFDLCAYSGRAMCGDKCLGAELNGGVGELVAELMHVAARLEPREITQLADALRGMRADSLGRGQIVYFPDVPFTANDDEPDYAELSDEDLEQLGDHGRTPAIQEAANQELLRRFQK